MDLGSFRDARPEFAQITDDEYVQGKLDEAARELSSSAWGTHYDDAHSLLTADLLWSSPLGATMRLDGGGDGKKSRYLEKFERLRFAVIPRITVT